MNGGEEPAIPLLKASLGRGIFESVNNFPPLPEHKLRSPSAQTAGFAIFWTILPVVAIIGSHVGSGCRKSASERRPK
jgi:hypothetical protein